VGAAKKKSKIYLFAVIAVVLAGLLALMATGCEEETTTTASEQDTSQTTAGGADTTAAEGVSFVMGYSNMFLADPFQAVEQDLSLAAAREAGLEVLEPTNADFDAAKQVTDIQTLISQGAEGILVVPVDAKAIAPAIEYSADKGVPIVCIDTAPEGGGAYMVVRADNVAMGSTAAETIGELLGGEGKVLELQGDLAQSAGRDRSAGFQATMAEKYPNIELVSRLTHWHSEEGVDAVQTVVSTDPDIDAIFLASDSCFLAGVLNVLDSLGETAKVGEEGHIVLVSIDGTPLSLQSIRDGRLDACISQPVDLYAKYGVWYLQQAVAGVTQSLGPTDHDSEIVEFMGNLSDFLKAPVITIDEVDQPNLWGNQAEI
jgi:ribose transport system substrate-binding protein